MKFKTKKVQSRFDRMNPLVQKLAWEMADWAMAEHKTLITITETFTTLEEDKALKRKSDTHRTGRAFDIRTSDLSEEFIEAFFHHFMFLYNERLGAITEDGPNLIYYRPHGTGPHFHVQIRRGI